MRAWSRKGLITGSTINEVISNRYRTFLECDHDSPWGASHPDSLLQLFQIYHSALGGSRRSFAFRRPATFASSAATVASIKLTSAASTA